MAEHGLNLCAFIWLAGWLAGWLVAWLTGWLVGRSVGWLVGWLIGYLILFNNFFFTFCRLLITFLCQFPTKALPYFPCISHCVSNPILASLYM